MKTEVATSDSIAATDPMSDECECDHEFERQPNGDALCLECGEVREYDGGEDDGRDFTEPYEP